MPKEHEHSLPWYREEIGYFGPEYLLQCQDMLTKERAVQETAFLVNTLGLKPGMRLLDCPCGHGRHSVEFATRGLTVIGLDLNEYLLHQAIANGNQEGVSAQWLQADMRMIPLGSSKVDCVVNLFSSFGYFERLEDNSLVLAEMARVLQPGGYLVLDVINRHILITNFRSTDCYETVGGHRITSRKSFDPVSGVLLDRRSRVGADGSISDVCMSLRIYGRDEIEDMLREAGFGKARCFGGYGGEEFSTTSRRCIVVSRKE